MLCMHDVTEHGGSGFKTTSNRIFKMLSKAEGSTTRQYTSFEIPRDFERFRNKISQDFAWQDFKISPKVFQISDKIYGFQVRLLDFRQDFRISGKISKFL